jgi:outer membrane immunogenic protein
MKKVFLLAFASMAISFAANSQTRIGAFLGNGSEVSRWGIGANAEFFINDKMAISPSILFYFPEKSNGVKVSVWEVNGNFNYYFLQQDVVGLYGLAGLNVTGVKVKYDNSFFGSGSASDSNVGINLGIGANFNVGSVLPFAEIKYVVSDYDQAVINLGVKFPIKD